MRTTEWTDDDGQRVVFSEAGGAYRISVYGRASLTNTDDGTIAIGVDVPPSFAAALDAPSPEPLMGGLPVSVALDVLSRAALTPAPSAKDEKQ